MPVKPFHARTFDDDDGGDDDDGDRSTLQYIFSSRLCPSVRPCPSLSHHSPLIFHPFVVANRASGDGHTGRAESGFLQVN